MLSVNPGTNFPIVRKLGDPSDSGTNYVRAVVRNSASGVTLKTVDLIDAGSQRFTGFYAVGSAENFFIDITTTVYTDSGYTTKSTVYSEENETYHIATNWGLQFGSMIGAGADVNYSRIKKIVQEVLEAKSFLEKADISNIVEESNSHIINVLGSISKQIKGIKFPDIEFPKQEPVNFSPILNTLTELKSLLTVLSNKKVDISNLEKTFSSSINDIKGETKSSQLTIRSMIHNIGTEIDQLIRQKIEAVDKLPEKTKELPQEKDMSRIQHLFPGKKISIANDKKDLSRIKHLL